MNEGAQVRNLFLVIEGVIRAKGGVCLGNATKKTHPLTGLGAGGEEERRSAWDLYGSRPLCKERRLQRLQGKPSDASGCAAR